MKRLLILSALALLAGIVLWPRAKEPGASAVNLGSFSVLKSDEAKAEQRVIAIVNQPITHLARTDEAAVYSPGWFHDGAIKPDFASVDVHATQEFPYAQSAYVTSDVTPSEMFLSKELEFNAMTKYFYTDRSLPKKRLSNAEMDEVNQLYRTIGADEHELTKQYLLAVALACGTMMTAYLGFLTFRK